MELSALGIDLAKSVFFLHGVNGAGKTVLSKKISRSQLLGFISNLPKCLIGMEACSGAHHWAREFGRYGHEVRLMAPQFVKPYVKSNKNDRADAEAICEAVTRPNMRYVPVKSVAQQEIQSLHRVRERMVTARTALINEIRGLLGEHGVVLPVGARKVRANALEALRAACDEEKLTSLGLQTFQELLDELEGIGIRIKRLTERLESIHRSHPVSLRISRIPGVGPLTATALIAAVGDPKNFKNGRQFSAWLGLVPRQHSSGGKERLLGISKRGDVYLRKLLIHGARTESRWIGKRTESRGSKWFEELEKRRGKNRAIVALANKNARRIWVLMATEQEYDPAA